MMMIVKMMNCKDNDDDDCKDNDDDDCKDDDDDDDDCIGKWDECILHIGHILTCIFKNLYLQWIC